MKRGFKRTSPVRALPETVFSGHTLDVPFTEEFKSGLGDWTVGLPGSVKPRVTEGTGSWSSKYGGSVRLHVDGGPNHIGLSRSVDAMKEGTEVTAHYESPDLRGQPGGPRIVIHPWKGDSFTIDMDNGGGGSAQPDTDGTLRGTLPRDMEAGAQIEIRLGVWPGSITVFVTRVSVAPPSSPVTETPRPQDRSDRTGTPTDSTSDGDKDARDGDGLSFVTDIERVRSCGLTCREITLSMTNTGDIDVADVSVDVTVRSGGTPVWTGTESVGAIATGDTYKVERRVDLSYEDAARVANNDSVVVIQSIVRTNRGNVVTERAYDLDTGEVRPPPRPDLREGSSTEVEVGNQTYYLITDIPGQPSDREAVTTTDYRLLTPLRAKAVIATDFWPQQRFESYDWSRRIQKTNALRERSLDFYRSGNYLDVGWDITEALLFTGTGLPPYGTILDGMTDVANVLGEQTNEPWKESFLKLTASLQNTQSLRGLTERVEWYEDIGETSPLQSAINFVLSIKGAVDTGLSLARAWSTTITAIRKGGSLGQALLQSSVRGALHTAKDLFLGLVISTTVGSMEGPVKLATDAHGLAHAWTTARTPVLRRLQDLDATLAGGDHSLGTGHEYYWHLLMDFQMKALAFEGSRRYWQAISDSLLGAVWDVVGNAQHRADTYGQWARNASEMAKTVAHIYGATEAAIGRRASNSLNATLASQGATASASVNTHDGGERQ